MERLIVGTEKNLKQLESRLFRTRMSKQATAAARTALEEANPHLDLDRLTPGAVIKVPDEHDFSVQGDAVIEDVTTIGAIAELFSAAIEESSASSTQLLKDAKAQRTKVSRLLRSKTVAKAAKEDPQLAIEVERVQAAVKAQEQLDKTRGAAAKKAFRQWAEDLDEARTLLPD